jgi:Tfp pilus assembly protein PilN
MADIDMIPRAYRDGVRVRRLLRVTGVALALTVALGIAGNIGLRWRTGALERAAAALQASSTQAQADSARAAQLQADQARKEQALTVLRTLRRRGELTALAQGLDAAMGDGVWLTGLNVEREIQAVASGPAGAAAGAAAVAAELAPEGSKDFSAGAQTWRMRSNLELSGQAVSYDAVTAFLSALGHQPGIAGLRLVSSSAAADGSAIDFRAAGALVQTETTP